MLKIRTNPDPILREKCQPIAELNDNLRQLMCDMADTMLAAGGIGLAAPQVGHALQLMVVDVRNVPRAPFSWARMNNKPIDLKTWQPMFLINPVVKSHGLPVKMGEGCLSLPRAFVSITRPSLVTVTALDSSLKPIEFEAGGLLARCIQHEYDHLNGVLLLDYV